MLRMSPTISLILLSILARSIPGSYSQSPTSDPFSTCGNLFNCGGVSGISYPFWGGSRTVACGHPLLELKCENNISKITLSNVNYRVLGIYPDVRAMKLVREDYSSGSFCSPSLTNSTFDPAVFSAVNGFMNFTFVYGCPTTVAVTFPSQFTCNITGIPNPGGYMIPGSVGPGGCAASVFFPIPSSTFTNINASESIITSQLQQGFEVGLNMDLTACTSCDQSNGVCGYDQATNGTICYCSDGSSSATGQCPATGDGAQGQTNSKGSSNKSLSIALPLAGAGLAGLLVGFLIFLCRQKNMRKKAAAEAQNKDLARTPASSKGVLLSMPSYSRTTPSYPTSKSDLEKGSTYFGVQVFSYLELEEATDNFNPSKELGDGGFGTVYYGKLQDQREVAVKRLYENNVKRMEQFMNEVEILTRLRHVNLVMLYGCTSRRSRELLLVYEYIPNGTVADHLHGRREVAGAIPWDVRLSIAIESADALAYLHESDVIHRDVKTNNILLDNDFRVKVADFGLSRLFPNDVTHVSTAPQGTPGYVDPEYYQCYQLTDKSDVYSFGVVLCELISSKAAVDTNRHRHDINLSSMAISKIQNHLLHELVDPSLGFETDYSVRRKATNMAELAFRCLQNERDMRPTMKEVLEALRKIERDEISLQSAEVVDIPSDEIAPLRNLHPPLSPDSTTSDKWIGRPSPPHSF